MTSEAETLAIAKNYKFISLDPEYEYIDNGNGTATITKYNGNDIHINIPSTLEQLRVTTIGERAFENKNLESIKIPNSVTLIDNYAFHNNKLSSLEIPNSVKILEIMSSQTIN